MIDIQSFLYQRHRKRLNPFTESVEEILQYIKHKPTCWFSILNQQTLDRLQKQYYTPESDFVKLAVITKESNPNPQKSSLYEHTPTESIIDTIFRILPEKLYSIESFRHNTDTHWFNQLKLPSNIKLIKTLYDRSSDNFILYTEYPTHITILICTDTKALDTLQSQTDKPILYGVRKIYRPKDNSTVPHPNEVLYPIYVGNFQSKQKSFTSPPSKLKYHIPFDYNNINHINLIPKHYTQTNFLTEIILEACDLKSAYQYIAIKEPNKPLIIANYNLFPTIQQREQESDPITVSKSFEIRSEQELIEARKIIPDSATLLSTFQPPITDGKKGKNWRKIINFYDKLIQDKSITISYTKDIDYIINFCDQEVDYFYTLWMAEVNKDSVSIVDRGTSIHPIFNQQNRNLTEFISPLLIEIRTSIPHKSYKTNLICYSLTYILNEIVELKQGQSIRHSEFPNMQKYIHYLECQYYKDIPHKMITRGNYFLDPKDYGTTLSNFNLGVTFYVEPEHKDKD